MYLNPIFRFIYWNMNYHIEHHMYPMVPYHALAALHEEIKHDCPPANDGIIDAWREILPAVFRQLNDFSFCVRKELPVGTGARATSTMTSAA